MKFWPFLARRAAQPASGADAREDFDHTLLGVLLALALCGLVMIYSTTLFFPDGTSTRLKYLPAHHFLLRQGISLALALAAGWLAFQVPMHFWERMAPRILLFAMLLLLLVLCIPYDESMKNPAKRWIPLGVMLFQPSELAKFALVLYVSDYMARKMEIRARFFRAVWPVAVVLMVLGLLLLLEPDLGAFMVLLVIALTILFLSGVSKRMLLLPIVLGLVVVVLVIVWSDWRGARIHSWLDMWSEKSLQGAGRQGALAMVAAARGGLWGQGLGGSVIKLHWMPEAHSDFLFSIFAEELGLLGVLALIAAFAWLVRRLVLIGRRAIDLERVFSGLAVQGIAAWLGFQAFFHMGVNMGALPTKGLPLPLLSYGGSALLMNAIALAVALRVDYENQLLRRGQYV